MEQQFTCPTCHQNYVNATVGLHAKCGVEQPNSKPAAPVVETPKPVEVEKVVEAVAEPVKTIAVPVKVEPEKVVKKRGRKPKSKDV